jgi:acetylornithine deacetylase
MLDLDFFREILSMDSTSGNEGALMRLLSDRLGALPGVHLVLSGEPGKPPYLFLFRGTPQVVFCTHVDTVPPYIPPTFHREDGSPCPPAEAYCIRGRGACDAKGQLLAMLTACERLAAEGCTDFGLLLVTGEETTAEERQNNFTQMMDVAFGII